MSKHNNLINKLVRNYKKRGWKSFIKRFCISAFLVCLFSFNSLPQIEAKTTAATGSSLFGTYYGDPSLQIGNVQAQEAWQGKKNAVINLFTTWCNQTAILDNLFNQQLLNIWNNQNVPLITWEPFFCSSSPNPTDDELRTITPGDIEVRAANGEYDAYFNTWSDRLKLFLSGLDGVYNTADDRRVYLRFAHEPNGDWYPWGAAKGGNTPADYIRMWQRVKSLFYDKGLDIFHVQWIWCVGHYDLGGYGAEAFYPGDQYVDWVSITGYNWSVTGAWADANWVTPEQVFGSMIGRLRALTTRPLSITELASTTSTTSGISVAAKSQWIADAFNYALAHNIKMILWFNQEKETDWAVFGGNRGDSTFTYNGTTYNTYAAYKTAIGSSSFVSSDVTNPRLLSNDQFGGW